MCSLCILNYHNIIVKSVFVTSSSVGNLGTEDIANNTICIDNTASVDGTDGIDSANDPGGIDGVDDADGIIHNHYTSIKWICEDMNTY